MMIENGRENVCKMLMDDYMQLPGYIMFYPFKEGAMEILEKCFNITSSKKDYIESNEFYENMLLECKHLNNGSVMARDFAEMIIEHHVSKLRGREYQNNNVSLDDSEDVRLTCDEVYDMLLKDSAYLTDRSKIEMFKSCKIKDISIFEMLFRFSGYIIDLEFLGEYYDTLNISRMRFDEIKAETNMTVLFKNTSNGQEFAIKLSDCPIVQFEFRESILDMHILDDKNTVIMLEIFLGGGLLMKKDYEYEEILRVFRSESEEKYKKEQNDLLSDYLTSITEISQYVRSGFEKVPDAVLKNNKKLCLKFCIVFLCVIAKNINVEVTDLPIDFPDDAKEYYEKYICDSNYDETMNIILIKMFQNSIAPQDFLEFINDFKEFIVLPAYLKEMILLFIKKYFRNGYIDC